MAEAGSKKKYLIVCSKCGKKHYFHATNQDPVCSCGVDLTLKLYNMVHASPISPPIPLPPEKKVLQK